MPTETDSPAGPAAGDQPDAGLLAASSDRAQLPNDPVKLFMRVG